MRFRVLERGVRQELMKYNIRILCLDENGDNFIFLPPNFNRHGNNRK